MNKIKLLKWKFNMFIAGLRYPDVGYYERMCLAAGYRKEKIDEIVNEAIKDKWIEKNDIHGREEVCEEEVSCWSY